MKTDYAIVVPNENGTHEVNYVTKFDNPTDANMIAQAIHGEMAYAIEANKWDIDTPAVYKDGIFYNIKEECVVPEDGSTPVVKRTLVAAERIRTEEERIKELENQIAEFEMIQGALDALLMER